jgi:glutaminase
VATVSGVEIGVGEAGEAFSLQSLTKLFALCGLLEHEPSAWQHVGWGPSQSGFDSIADLESRGGQPPNPFVNAGALVVTDRLRAHTGQATPTVVRLMQRLSGDFSIQPDPAMAASELRSRVGHRNTAIGHVLAERGRLIHPVADVVEDYTHQCSIAASPLSTARAALLLATRRPGSPSLTIDTRRVNAVLLTSGMYGGAGDIAFRIGLPAKSGIGGGVVAIMPGVGAVCAWSPPLDARGNSVGGMAAIETFAEITGWSVF